MEKKKEPVSLKSLDAGQDIKKISLRIKELRRKKGFTSYEAFANEHDIHRVQWGRYENGEDMRLSTLLKIIRLFEVTPEEFFRDF